MFRLTLVFLWSSSGRFCRKEQESDSFCAGCFKKNFHKTTNKLINAKVKKKNEMLTPPTKFPRSLKKKCSTIVRVGPNKQSWENDYFNSKSDRTEKKTKSWRVEEMWCVLFTRRKTRIELATRDVCMLISVDTFSRQISLSQLQVTWSTFHAKKVTGVTSSSLGLPCCWARFGGENTLISLIHLSLTFSQGRWLVSKLQVRCPTVLVRLWLFFFCLQDWQLHVRWQPVCRLSGDRDPGEHSKSATRRRGASRQTKPTL